MTEEGLRIFITPMAKVVFWLCLFLVVMLSLWPASDYPMPPTIWADKIQHLFAYLVLGLLLGFGYSGQIGRGLIILLALSGGLELLQGLPPIGRTTSLFDFMANGAGLVVAALLLRVLRGKSQA